MWSTQELSAFSESRLAADEVARLSTLLLSASVFESWTPARNGFLERFKLGEAVLEAAALDVVPAEEVGADSIRLATVSIRVYRPFVDVDLSLGALTAIVGANATRRV